MSSLKYNIQVWSSIPSSSLWKVIFCAILLSFCLRVKITKFRPFYFRINNIQNNYLLQITSVTAKDLSKEKKNTLQVLLIKLEQTDYFQSFLKFLYEKIKSIKTFFKQCLDFEWPNLFTNGHLGIFYSEYIVSFQKTENLLKMGCFLAELCKSWCITTKLYHRCKKNP